MLSHVAIWNAIDRLARDHGLTASGLARRAGLDPTTFNPSKRVTRQGKPRWPSTESVAKVLDATGARLDAFVAYMADDGAHGLADATPRGRTIPVIGSAQAGTEGFFDDAGYPVGGAWDEIPFPEVGDPHAYALEVSGDSMEPVYRDGDTLIVSPASPPRRGDRVVLRTRHGEVMVKELLRHSARRVELRSLNPDHEDRVIPAEDVDWMARVLWVSQ